MPVGGAVGGDDAFSPFDRSEGDSRVVELPGTKFAKGDGPPLMEPRCDKGCGFLLEDGLASSQELGSV